MSVLKKARQFKRLFWLFAALAAVGMIILGRGQAWCQDEKPISLKWELYDLQEPESYENGLLAVLWLIPEQDWYTYSDTPGPMAKPTEVTAVMRPGDAPLPVYFPPGKRKPDALAPEIISEVYEQATPLFIPLARVAPGDEISARIELLACTTGACMPFVQKTTFNVGAAVPIPAADQDWRPIWLAAKKRGAAVVPTQSPEPVPGVETPAQQITEWDFNPRYYSPGLEVAGLGKAVILALLAGFILNFMPCVLPVVSFKIFSLFQHESQTTSDRRCSLFCEHNLFFSLGILIYFLVFSIIAGLAGLAWGEVFQSPAVVIVMILVVFALSLSFFGIYDLPIIDLKFDQKTKNTKLQALFTGMLATLLATPCSGPFLGGVLAWAMIQPPVVITAVLFCVGLGMASPFLAMAAFPGLLRFFPKPGPWAGHLQRVMGFILLATCVYLLSLLPNRLLFDTLVLMLAAAFAAWMWGELTGLRDSLTRRMIVRSLAVAVVVVTAVFVYRAPVAQVQWEPFVRSEFTAALGTEPIVMDFTADWCPNCKFLEHTTLSDENLARWKEKYGVRYIQVDITREDPVKMGLLRSLGSQSIPVVAIFPKGSDSKNPVVLRDIFTTGQMEAALSRALPRD